MQQTVELHLLACSTPRFAAAWVASEADGLRGPTLDPSCQGGRPCLQPTQLPHYRWLPSKRLVLYGYRTCFHCKREARHNPTITCCLEFVDHPYGTNAAILSSFLAPQTMSNGLAQGATQRLYNTSPSSVLKIKANNNSIYGIQITTKP